MSKKRPALRVISNKNKPPKVGERARQLAAGRRYGESESEYVARTQYAGYVSQVRELQGELDRVRAERDALHEQCKALRSENEALRLDGARRW